MLSSLRVKFCRHALARDMISAGALGFAGDVVCQLGAERRRLPESPDKWRWRERGEPAHDESVFDPRRLASLTAFNTLYIGGFLHFLYQAYPVVTIAVASRLPVGKALRSKLLNVDTLPHAHACAWVDNVHCGSIYIPAYFMCVGLLQGDSASESAVNLRGEFLPTYLSCTLFWVPYMWANFALVPAVRRVQAMAVGNLAWSAIVDYLAHRSLGKSDQ